MNLPDVPFNTDRPGPVARDFLVRGVQSFGAAAAFVHALPYGRTQDRSAYRLVLREGRGTCSTKHALLAALAREEDLAVELRLGVYMMSEANTPGVGAPLDAHGFAAIPEAHCYLLHDGVRVDLTHLGGNGALHLEILEEHSIAPEDIGQRKIAIHSAFVEKWAREERVIFEHAWRAREACIAALSSPPRASR